MASRMGVCIYLCIFVQNWCISVRPILVCFCASRICTPKNDPCSASRMSYLLRCRICVQIWGCVCTHCTHTVFWSVFQCVPNWGIYLSLYICVYILCIYCENIFVSVYLYVNIYCVCIYTVCVYIFCNLCLYFCMNVYIFCFVSMNVYDLYLCIYMYVSRYFGVEMTMDVVFEYIFFSMIVYIFFWKYFSMNIFFVLYMSMNIFFWKYFFCFYVCIYIFWKYFFFEYFFENILSMIVSMIVYDLNWIWILYLCLQFCNLFWILCVVWHTVKTVIFIDFGGFWKMAIFDDFWWFLIVFEFVYIYWVLNSMYIFWFFYGFW